MIDLHCADALAFLPTMEAGSVDCVVTDPPAGISFMAKEWDSDRGGRIAWAEWLASVFAECLRVARPGAVALVWALPRTSHWTATALEDAGWRIEDRITHLFGQGFPKHHSKLKPAAEDWWLCRKPGPLWLGVEEGRIEGPGWSRRDGEKGAGYKTGKFMGSMGVGEPTQANGLRRSPAGRWPPNVALSHHEECRCVGTQRVKTGSHRYNLHGTLEPSDHGNQIYGDGLASATPNGRCHVGADGLETLEAWECHPECPVRLLDEQSGERISRGGSRGAGGQNGAYSPIAAQPDVKPGFGDFGGASRFFYCAKASRKDRGTGNTHPTVKPLALMRWLIALACPPGGLVLDPFAGSFTTAVACVQTGRRFLGCDSSEEYCAIGHRRVAEALAAQQDGPLFAAAPTPEAACP